VLYSKSGDYYGEPSVQCVRTMRGLTNLAVTRHWIKWWSSQMKTPVAETREVEVNDDYLPAEVLPTPMRPWPEEGFNLVACVKSGALIGAIAGCVSLAANVIASVAWPTVSGQSQHPLKLIQVFLTFPLGENALQLNGGWLLAAGCLLFLATGALYGVLFELAMSYFLPRARLAGRMVFFSLLAIAVWIVNFYCILIWLQPLLFGGAWIVEQVPWWVAALTHALFGATVAVIHPFETDRRKHDLKRRNE
jgi:hypothetical protein